MEWGLPEFHPSHSTYDAYDSFGWAELDVQLYNAHLKNKQEAMDYPTRQSVIDRERSQVL